MPLNKDYYKILGVAPVATIDEIKLAYRQLSKKYHPDLNPDLKIFSDEKMKQLVEAYNSIQTDEKRKAYDSQPQFQIRKSRSGGAKLTSNDSKLYTQKPDFHRVPSLLERVFSPFMKKKDDSGVCKVDPKQADIHFTLGLSMCENPDFYDQAINEFKLTLKFQPDYPEAQYNCGILCYRMGYYEEAAVCFQRVLSISKKDQHAYKMIQLLRDDFQ